MASIKAMSIGGAGAAPVATSIRRNWLTDGMMASQSGNGSSSARKAGAITGVRKPAEPIR